MAHATGDSTRADARSRVEISEHPQNVTPGGIITSRAFEHSEFVATCCELNCAHRLFQLRGCRCFHFSRANARPRIETCVCPQGVEALAFCCRHYGKGAHNPANWLIGCNARLQGEIYFYPTDARDHLACSAEFIEGRAQQGEIDRRLRGLAGIRITPLFARLSCELWRRRR
jgi:hypothetical protein